MVINRSFIFNKLKDSEYPPSPYMTMHTHERTQRTHAHHTHTPQYIVLVIWTLLRESWIINPHITPSLGGVWVQYQIYPFCSRKKVGVSLHLCMDYIITFPQHNFVRLDWNSKRSPLPAPFLFACASLSFRCLPNKWNEKELPSVAA